MTKHSPNARSKRPCIMIRVSPDVFRQLEARVTSDLALAKLAEMYLVAGLQAEGVDVRQVSVEAREARRLAAEIMKEVGRAVKETIGELLEKYGR